MTRVLDRPWVDEELAAAVASGLGGTPKSLPPWMLYDAEGSRLFERITTLPSYYLTRAETEILAGNADAILDAAGAPADVVELGAGTATKTQHLLAALARRRPRVRYFPVDVSAAPLAKAFVRLGRDLPAVSVNPLLARQEAALASLAGEVGTRLVLWLGSSVGNLEAEPAVGVLRLVRAAIGREGALVLGTDLCGDPSVLLPAYDDPEGVTAAFNRNVLVRIDRELGADFDAPRFRHVALWNAAASRVEMHLETPVGRRVKGWALAGEVVLAARERIHTESSAKYTLPSVDVLLGAAGLDRVETWTDRTGRFGVHVARVGAARASRWGPAAGERAER